MIIFSLIIMGSLIIALFLLPTVFCFQYEYSSPHIQTLNRVKRDFTNEEWDKDIDLPSNTTTEPDAVSIYYCLLYLGQQLTCALNKDIIHFCFRLNIPTTMSPSTPTEPI